MRHSSVKPVKLALALSALCAAFSPHLSADTKTWVPANGTWSVVVNDPAWSPTGDPTSFDDVIFNTNNNVLLGSSKTILSLNMSLGIDLNTNNFNLSVL